MSPESTTDHEEKEQCTRMHEIIAEYKLDGEFRYTLSRTPILLERKPYLIQ